MKFLYFCRLYRIRWRFLRFKLAPWIMLIGSATQLPFQSGLQRTQAEIRCLQAMSKIDFPGFYEFLSDLIW